MPCASEFTSTAGLLTCAEHHDAVIVIDAACAIAATMEKQHRFATGPLHGHSASARASWAACLRWCQPLVS